MYPRILRDYLPVLVTATDNGISVPWMGIKDKQNRQGATVVFRSRVTMAVLARNWRLLASSSSNGRGLATVGSESGETKLVKIPELGEVKGSTAVTAWSQRKFYQFLGIRYAEPPTGKLRFKVSQCRIVMMKLCQVISHS